MPLTSETTALDRFLADHRALASAQPLAPIWLIELRAAGAARLAEVGLPTTRDEEWRYTSLRPLNQTPWRAPSGQPAGIDRARIDRLAIDGPFAARLVMIDGRYAPDLSSLPNDPRGSSGLSVSPLSQATTFGDATWLRQHLGRYAAIRDDPFNALSAALLADGAVIRVAHESVIDLPVHVLHVCTSPRAHVHPRHLIVAEAGSRATVVEHYVSLGDEPSFANVLTEAVVAETAHLTHYVVEEENEQSISVQTLRVRQAAKSRFESHTALFGGGLVRNNVEVELAGPRCDSLVNGLFIGRGTQHLDNHMRVVHAAEHCDSRQFYKGILDEKSRGVFSGRIVVLPGAQKTDAKQTSRNLLLSDDARIDAKPQLEIYADDVKCTHGATTGRLDNDALFYLTARGIPPRTAHGLLVLAFARESLDRMELPPVRDRLARDILHKLRGVSDVPDSLEPA